MENEKISFDESLKSSLEGYEFPFDAGSWSEFEKQLNAGEKVSAGRRIWYAVAAIAVGAVSWYFISEPLIFKPMCGLLAEKVQLTHSAEAGQSRDGYEAGLIMRLRAESSNSESTSPISETNFNADQAIATGATQTSNEKPVASPATSAVNELVLMPSKREACVGEVVGFGINLKYSGEEKFLWNFGDGIFSNQSAPAHKYAQPGTYDVSLSITSNTDGVIRSSVMERLVVVYPKPDAKFDWEFLNKSFEPTKVKFLNKSESASQSSWFIDDQVFSGEISPVESFVTKGDHAIKLTVVNDFGCSDDRYKYLKIDSDYKLLASEECSIGQGFMPKALKLMKRPFNMSILDEQNNSVYLSSDINKPWNCTLSDGQAAPIASKFNWVVTMKGESGKDVVYSGQITLIP